MIDVTTTAGLSGEGAAVRALTIADPLADARRLRELREKWLVWDAFVGGERRVDLHPLVLSEATHRAAVRVAESVVRAVGRAAAIAHDDADERALYGFDADVLRLAAASREAGDDASMMRVDLLLGEDGVFRACEINADCPGGHNEAAGLPALLRGTGFDGGYDPSTNLVALTARLADLARRPDGSQGAVALLHATAYAEDLQICALLKRSLERAGVRAVLAPPTAPRRVPGVGLRVGETMVRALYRYFPTEYTAGHRNVGDLEEAVRVGEVKTLTSYAHMFAQSKLSLARAWARQADLAREDAIAVRAYVPESIDAADAPRAMLLAEREGWVLKRALGRVGDQVYVGSLCDAPSWSELVEEVLALRAEGDRWIAQRVVPQRPVPTPLGPRLVTLGVYVLDGRFVGYFARLTPESHVSHDALVVPVVVEPDRARARAPHEQEAIA
jgi:hypothetical protein